MAHDDLDWAPLGLEASEFVNLMTARSEPASAEFLDLAARSIEPGAGPGASSATRRTRRGRSSRRRSSCSRLPPRPTSSPSRSGVRRAARCRSTWSPTSMSTCRSITTGRSPSCGTSSARTACARSRRSARSFTQSFLRSPAASSRLILTPARDGSGSGGADNESAVKTAPPPIDCRAVNRLLEQCARPSGPAPEARPAPGTGSRRSWAVSSLGASSAHCAGDHAAPVRAFGETRAVRAGLRPRRRAARRGRSRTPRGRRR